MSNILLEIEKSNQTNSYEELFKKHSKLIYKLIYNFINSQNLLIHSSEVDDIHQEVALKIFKNDYLSSYNKKKSSFITWLNIICRTTTIDFYRKRIRWMESILAQKDATSPFQQADIILFSLPADVLTKRQTQVITLFYKDGLVAGEIAQKLDITARTVRSIKFQALERLRAYYGAANRALKSHENEEPGRKVS